MLFRIKVPIFHKKSAIYFFHGTDEEFVAAAKKYKFPRDIKVGIDANEAAFTYVNGLFCLIRFSREPFSDHDIIAHEIFHAAVHLWKYVGLRLSDDSEEAYAYLIDFITEEFYKQFKDYVDSIQHTGGTRTKNKTSNKPNKRPNRNGRKTTKGRNSPVQKSR